MSRYIVMGVDPGTGGGVAFYEPGQPPDQHPGMVGRNGPVLAVFDMPVVRAKRGKVAMDVDTAALMELVYGYGPSIAFVEQVSSRPRQGGQFSFGVNLGRILGALETAGRDGDGIPITHVSASRWKPALGLRGENKLMSVKLAEQLFPALKQQFYGPRGAALDGRAEAILIAYYGAHHA